MSSATVILYAMTCVVLCATLTLSAPEMNDQLRQRPEVVDNSVAGSLHMKQQAIYRQRRASSFIRIGKSQNVGVEESEGLDDVEGDVPNSIGDEHYSDKKASSFVRIGKALSDERDLLSYEVIM